MAGFDGVGNLTRNGVRPLRPTARPARAAEEPAQRFSVRELKNGGSLDLSGVAAPSPAAEGTGTESRPAGRTLRQRYRGGGPAPSARQAQNSKLSENEQLEKLAKIRKSAIEYEAVFVDQLVKQMRQSPLAEVPGGEALNDLAEQPFRDFLSQAGGLGLADSIVSQIARQEGLEQTLQNNPGVMGPGWRPKVPPNLMKKSAGDLDIAPESTASPPPAAPEPASRPAAQKTEDRPVGLMSAEEIAYLYQDARDGAA